MSDGHEQFSFQIVNLEDNPDSTFKFALEYWATKRAANFAPPWSKIELIDFPPAILPNCIVVDIKSPIDTSSYRYCGTGIVDLHGIELTRRTINEVQPKPLRDHVIKQYQLVCDSKKPMIFATQFVGKGGQNLNHLMLRLPLSEDAENVTNIITFEVFDNYSNDLHEIYAAMPQ